jgi:hypothetical protein
VPFTRTEVAGIEYSLKSTSDLLIREMNEAKILPDNTLLKLTLLLTKSLLFLTNGEGKESCSNFIVTK